MTRDARCRLALGYRFQLDPFIRRNSAQIDALEITIDHYLSASSSQRRTLRELRSHFHIVSHGVGLSLGSAGPVDRSYLFDISDPLRLLAVEYYSEHLAFTGLPGRELATLLPVPKREDVISHVVQKILEVKKIVPLPFLLENIVNYFEYPDSEMSESAFLSSVCTRSGAKILLDVENLYANEMNNGVSATGFVDELPEGMIRAVHVAGGEWQDGLYFDDHGHSVPDEVLDLLAYVLDRHNPDTVILERDRRFGELDEIANDLKRIRGLVDRHNIQVDRDVVEVSA